MRGRRVAELLWSAPQSAERWAGEINLSLLASLWDANTVNQLFRPKVLGVEWCVKQSEPRRFVARARKWYFVLSSRLSGGSWSRSAPSPRRRAPMQRFPAQGSPCVALNDSPLLSVLVKSWLNPSMRKFKSVFVGIDVGRRHIFVSTHFISTHTARSSPRWRYPF